MGKKRNFRKEKQVSLLCLLELVAKDFTKGVALLPVTVDNVAEERKSVVESLSVTPTLTFGIANSGSVQSSLSQSGSKNMFGNNHFVEKRSEQSHSFLLEDSDEIEAIGERLDNQIGENVTLNHLRLELVDVFHPTYHHLCFAYQILLVSLQFL